MLGEVRAESGSADVERKIHLHHASLLVVRAPRGTLSIATQEPNLSHSPSLLWSCPGFRSGLMLGEVRTGPGSAGVEHTQVGRKSIKFKEFKRKYYSPYCRLNTKREFKRLPEA